jgi:hypothetical protein
MGQASAFRPIALIVDDDVLQRELGVTLLEESEMGVIQCESAEGVLRVKVIRGRPSPERFRSLKRCLRMQNAASAGGTWKTLKKN